jgi:Dehydrogenases with different specificities (related to short-chain alcohol dehydrogenases)
MQSVPPVARRATLAPLDIAEVEAMRHLCRHVFERWGRVDLWAHCAIHAPPMAPAGHIDPRDWERALAVNARAPGLMIPMVEPLLRAAPAGQALFLDDPRAGQKFFGAYGATKAAQTALARSWQAEAARVGPQVRVETPAPMPTALRARFFPGEDRSRLTPCADEAERLVALLVREATRRADQ